MEESKDYKRLDELFEKARSSEPVMAADEIRHLISTAPFATLDNANPQKSNKGLYLLLAGIMLVATVGGIWYMLTDTPSIVNQNSIAPNVNENSQIPASKELNVEKAENKIDSSISEKTAGIDENNNTVKQYTTEVASATKTDVAAINEAAPAVVSKENVNEKSNTNLGTNTSSNKTSIVRGSDMEVKITDAGKDITMKVKQDYSVDDLTINGNEIAESDYKKYKNYIDQGVKIAMDDRANKPDANVTPSKSPEDQKRDDLNTRLFNSFSEQLKKDKLINQEKFSFKLTSSEMQIDGKTLPATVQKKYLDLFKTIAGRDLGGATFKFEHGLK